MYNIPLVRVNAISPFIKFLNQIGSPTDRLLRQAKLPIFAFDNPEALLPLYQVLHFVEQAANVEKIAMFGFVVAQRTTIGDLGLFGQLIQQSLTLYDLLKTVELMLPAFSSRERMWLVEERDRIWLNHQLLCPATVKDQQANMYSILLYLKAIRLATGPEWQPLHLRLRPDYPRKITEIEEFANVPVYFDQPHNAIAIPKSLLSLPLRNRAFSNISQKDCYHSLQTTAPSVDFAESLEQLLRSLLRDGYPDIQVAAEASGSSVRSFQRRLAEANLNYSDVVEQVRFDRAIQLLHNNIQIIDIAGELGYKDAANFTRAFKRWTGVSPREYRRLHINS